MIDSVRIRYTKLIEKCIKASKAYYQGKPFISDAKYDSMYKDICEIEYLYPNEIDPNSPTQKIYADVISTAIVHKNLMLSIESVTDYQCLVKKLDKRGLGNNDLNEIYLDYKMDGLAIEVVYEKGLLTSISTRGDGSIGDNITHNHFMFNNLPFKLNTVIDIELYGEAILTTSVLTKIKELYGNTNNLRNKVAGMLNSEHLNPKYTNLISFYCYYTPYRQKELHTHLSKTIFVANLGIHIVQGNIIEFNDLQKFYSNCLEYREKLPYEIDGLVLKANSLTLQDKLGYLAKAPRWAVGWKFPPPSVVTTLNDVIWDVGATGRVNPKGLVSPTVLKGKNISSVNLYNHTYIKENDIRLGCKLKIGFLRDIVPGILEISHADKSLPEIKIPTHCPSCGNELTKRNTYLLCTNLHCKTKTAKFIYNVLNKKGIKGINVRTLLTLIEELNITDYKDLLLVSRAQLLSLFGNKKGSTIFKLLQIL